MTVVTRREEIYRQVFYDQESQFVAIVKKELSRVLPDFAILDFSPYVLGDEGHRSRPDLALVDRHYRMWSVVEVELENHSLKHHVEPQIRAFVTGQYDDSHARYIAEREPTLCLDRLYNLIPYHPPAVMVVVNSRSVRTKGWVRLEKELSAHLTFIEPFRASNGDVLFSISGYLPIPPARRLMRLKKHRMLNALICNQVGDIPATIEETMCLYWEERPYMWTVLRTKDSGVFLAPSGINLRNDRNYEIREADDSIYRLHQL